MSETIIQTLKERFENHPERHDGISWVQIESRLTPEALAVLTKMEKSGGEPDVIGYHAERGVYLYCDTSKESPPGRRSLCYDRTAWEARKANKPVSDAHTVAAEIGVRITTVEEYRLLQQTGDYDLKSSSWIETPEKIRALGGGLFGDKRYDTVFIYHNGVESYYAARGFRGILEI